MIKRINLSEKDQSVLDQLSHSISNEQDQTNYQKILIQKPWGSEYLAFENDKCAVWILNLKHEGATSLHCHPRKKTSLAVLDGEIIFTTLNESMMIKKGEGVFIDKGVFHSSRAVSPNGAVVLETETPNNKKDLLRYSDNYGREGKGYENKNHHQPLGQNFVHFHDPETRYNIQKPAGDSTLTVVSHFRPESLIECIKNHPANICIILSGSIARLESDLLREGEILKAQSLRECEALSIIEFTELLLIH